MNNTDNKTSNQNEVNPDIEWYYNQAIDLLKYAKDQNDNRPLPLLQSEIDGKWYTLAFFETDQHFNEILERNKQVFDLSLAELKEAYLASGTREQSDEAVKMIDAASGAMLLSTLLQTQAMLLLGKLKYS